jgi:hypothetical protein
MAHACSRSLGGIRARATSRAAKPTRSAPGTKSTTSSQAGCSLSQDTTPATLGLATKCQLADTLLSGCRTTWPASLFGTDSDSNPRRGFVASGRPTPAVAVASHGPSYRPRCPAGRSGSGRRLDRASDRIAGADSRMGSERRVSAHGPTVKAAHQHASGRRLPTPLADYLNVRSRLAAVQLPAVGALTLQKDSLAVV